MAENIRLKISVQDLASAELKRVTAALKRLEGPIDEVSFRFQYGFSKMQDAVGKFSTSSFVTKIKSLANSVKSAVDKMRSAWDSFSDKTENARGRMSKAVDGMKGTLKSLHSALTGLPAMLAGGALTAAFGGAIVQGLKFNATLETLKTQFQVMTGDADRAAGIMRSLVQFAATTPFELADVANSARVMMAYGLQGKETLRRIGDAAAAANVPMDEMANTFGRIKSGAFGEAFQRLAETGVATRKMLEGEGLVFDKGGSFVGTADQAMAAVERIVDKRFTGMMDKMSQTMAGKMSTLKDDIAMTLGIVTGKLFDDLKPQLDRVSAAFKRMREGGTATGFSAMLSSAVSPVVDKVIGMIESPEKVFGWFMRAGDQAKAVFDTVKAGATWLWNTTTAFFAWLFSQLEVTGLKVEKAIAKMSFGKIKWADEEEQRLTDATAALMTAKIELDTASAQPGAAAAWSVAQAAIALTDYELRMKAMMRSGASATSAVILGKDSGGDPLRKVPSNVTGIGTPQALPSGAMMDTRAGYVGLSRESFGADRLTPASRFDQSRFASTGGFGQGPARLGAAAADFSADLASGSGKFNPNLALAAANDNFREEQKALFKDYYQSLAGMGETLFVDSMSTIILSKHEDLKLALNDIWQGMKGNFVKMTVGMALEWGKAKIKMLLAEKAFAGGKAGVEAAGTAAHAANATVNNAIDATEKKSALATAAAKIWKAFAGLPFIGQVLAVGAIALMLKSVGAFASGGIVPGGGSGNEDDKTIRVSGGEGVITKRAVDANGGRSFIDAINSGRAGAGSTANFSFSISGGNAEALRLDIERDVVPVLERLVRQRRAVLA